MKTRWTLFAGLVAALIAGGCNVTAELGEPLPGDTVEDKVAECRLRELAPDGLHIGNVYNDWLINDASDAAQNAGLLSSRFDMVSPEYSLAMNEIWTSERAIDFAAVDRFFDFARAHGMHARISHLLWHEAIPDWLEQGGYSASEVRDHVEWYVKTLLPYVVANYADVAREWNVVNEVISNTGPEVLHDSFWKQNLGDDFVAWLFGLARQYDPGARLYVNDYGLLGSSAWNQGKRARMYALLQDLKARGVPVHGIGFQGHLALEDHADDVASMPTDLALFAGLSLDIAFTELDIMINNDLSGLTQAKLDAQAAFFADVVRDCRAEPACRSLSFWGLTDPQSYVNKGYASWLEQDEDWPLLFDADRQPKPACTAVARALIE